MKVLYVLILSHLCWGRQFNQNAHSSSVTAKEGNIESILSSWIKTISALQSLGENLAKRFEPLANKLASSSLTSPNCLTSLEQLQRGIVKMTPWAYKMIDSAGKFRDSILSGNVVSLGDYDTCLDVDAIHFQGKYCRLEFKIPLPKRSISKPIGKEYPESLGFLDNETVMSEIVRQAGYLQNLNPQASLCIPSTCTEKDLQNVISEVTDLSVVVKNCETKEDLDSRSLFDYIMIVFFLCLFLMVLVATTIELYLSNWLSRTDDYQESLGNCLKSLLSFSLISNTTLLLRKDDNPDSIRVFHGMRVISTLWVILGNTYLILYPVAYGSYLANKDIPKEFWFQFIANSSVAMETFFFISSALLAYQITKAKEMNLSISGILIRRYIRTSIPLLGLIASFCLLPQMNSGPVFEEIIGPQVKNCKEHSWMNLLYLNNFVHFPKMCLNISWFLAVDAQLYLLSIFILVPFKKAPKYILYLVGIFLATGILMTVLTQFMYGLPPTTLSWYSHIEDMIYIWEKSQFLPHVHLPNYCVGLAVGYILATKKDACVSGKRRLTMWILAFTVGFGIAFGVLTFNRDVNNLDPFFSVTYGSFYRVLWALTLSWLTVDCTFNNQSLVSRFLGSEAFVKFSRLSNLAYLIHMNVKMFYISTIRRTIPYDHITMVYLFVSISTISYILAMVFNLFFKSPLLRIVEDLMIKWTNKENGKVK